MFLTPVANDWLHGNAVSYTREDGNLTLSMPEQDWVIKIDYARGKGSGKVLWRLGDEGDFKAESSDPKPWFSYQHDAAFEPPGSNTLVLLDNGQRRKEKEKDAPKIKTPKTKTTKIRTKIRIRIKIKIKTRIRIHVARCGKSTRARELRPW